MTVPNNNNNNDNDDDNEDGEISLKSSNEIFDDMTQELLAKYRTSAQSSNPFASRVGSSSRNVGKGSVYSDSQLMDLLSVHNDIQMEDDDGEEEDSDDGTEEEDDDFVNTGSSSEVSSSLHELILQTTTVSPSSITDSIAVENADTDNNNNNPNNHQPKQQSPAPPSLPLQIMDDVTRNKLTNIRAIASDVDGTLLTTSQSIHPRTRMALRRAIDRANASANANEEFVFFPATGKSKQGAMDSLGVEVATWLQDSNAPGVFLQGLYCVNGNGDVLFEQKLTTAAIAGAESLVNEHGISIVGYDGSNLYTTQQTDIVIHLHEHYGEPLPCILPTTTATTTTADEKQVTNLADHAPGLHKLLLLDDDTDRLANVIRPQLELIAEQSDACVTQAIPTMLEVLPKGCSKAVGVSKVCEALGIDMATQLLAIGDAENDKEMLQQAAIGVAVANGCAVAKEAADFVMHETNNEGGAGAAMELFGFGPQPDMDI